MFGGRKAMKLPRARRSDNRAQRVLQQRSKIFSQSLNIERQVLFERGAGKGDDSHEFSEKFVGLHE
jgi:hypothetical protein